MAQYGRELGVEEDERAQSGIDLLTDRIQEFVLADRDSEVNLVLGRVQSGKTAHMIGTTAWCADHGIGMVIVLSGATKNLMLQTLDRFTSDLGDNEPERIKVTATLPTISQRSTEKFRLEIRNLVEQRSRALESGTASPMPVITVLKHPKRVEALNGLFGFLTDQLGAGLTALVIDDEADQLSPNSKIQKREQSNLHAELLKLASTGVRYFLAEYTATPQAVLLNEQDGAIQPREVVTIEPGSTYFGLSSLMDSSLALNRISVPDLNSNDEFAIPEELQLAILEFFIASQIRRNNPNIFFGNIEDGVQFHNPQLSSCQMLVHPSGKKRDHVKFALMVKECIERLAQRIDWITNFNLEDPQYASIQQAYENVSQRLGTNRGTLSEQISEFSVRNLAIELRKNTFIKVVNSDRNAMGKERPLPVKTKDWNEFNQWILVGGEILGRGITIPGLLLTYFLRNPRSHNFDTAVQQMRFCGYRRTFSSFVTVWAPKDIFDLYSVMNEVDETLWMRARRWCGERRDLLGNRPSILYVSSPEPRLNAARKSVIARELRDRSVNKNVVLQTRYLSHPLEFSSNSRLVTDVVLVDQDENFPGDEWKIFYDFRSESMMNILLNWRSRQQGTEFRHASELFEPELGEHGLSGIPLTLFVRGLDVIKKASRNELFDDRSVRFSRSMAIADYSDAMDARREWDHCYQTGSRSMTAKWFDSSSTKTYVGETQRKLKRDLGYNSTVVMIEPIALRDVVSKKAVGIGLALGFLAPDGYQVRTIGLE